MLIRLTVTNYALITSLNVEFNEGLNSVTGETGAGKSIILGALGLILGNRADLSVLKQKEEKCIVEGTFSIGQYKLRYFFEEYDLDYDESTILRREITPSGKSRAFINDTPVNLKIMRELGLKLIDIHSQHQNLELGNQKYQLELVDTVANSGKILQEYKLLYNCFNSLQKELKEVTEKSEQAAADLDYFQFQFNQLDEANLQEEEQEELEAELEKLTHAEDIKGAFLEVQKLLDDENFSAIQNLKDSHKRIAGIQDYFGEASELAARLESCHIELRDILDETFNLGDKIDHDPARIEQVNDRLNIIYSLQQKHHAASVKELIELKNSFEEKIALVTGYEDEMRELKEKLEKNRADLSNKSAELTKIRKAAFPKIEKSVVTDLKQLGMPKSKFTIQHENLPEFTPAGKDAVAFLFSANSDIAPAEISKIASGGEMSRLMLAIKNILRVSKALPTVIFDEIDSGVSGEIALKMGAILREFSQSTQIINITHLPQIAAKGNAHFVVYKYEKNGKTFTSIRQLETNERIEELAKMVGGESVTETTLDAAKELLKN
jgi:DNA repair protein RecN (Recombination protein N)